MVLWLNGLGGITIAHEVETMMYVGDTPRHGLGVAIPEGKKLSIEEAIKAVGLD